MTYDSSGRMLLGGYGSEMFETKLIMIYVHISYNIDITYYALFTPIFTIVFKSHSAFTGNLIFLKRTGNLKSLIIYL